MKIGIVCPYNIALPGGVQQHVFEQAAELRSRGHHVILITPKPRGKILTNDPEVAFLGTSARVKTPQHTSVDVSISVTTDAIDELLNKENFDIIHMHEPLIPILARQMLPRIECPVVGTFHAALPDTFIAKSIAGSILPFIKSVVKHLQAVTAVSKPATSYVGNYVSLQDVHIIPNGVDLVKYHLPTKPVTRKGILYVGRLEKRKGVKFLIDAFAELLKTNLNEELIIAGNGPDRAKLQALVEEYGIENKVNFLGYINDATKQKLMHECALFVSPALYGESFGIVLIEAMASGAVVLGGFNPGYATVLSGSGAIGLVDPQDTALFVNRIQLLLHDVQIREMLQKWAQQEVKKYSYKSIVDQYEKIYKSLV